jgi:hypothetical protein
VTSSGSRLLRLSRARLVAAVAPESLGSVLRGLRVIGVIEGFEERRNEVLIWGDLTALEAQLGFKTAVPEGPLDSRGEYYRLCRNYCSTLSFRRLPILNRQIWRLHADGVSWQAICGKLGVTEGKVRIAIQGARLAAKLPRNTNTMPRGSGLGRPPAALRPQCRVAGCGVEAEARGLCNACYCRIKKIAMRRLFA